MVGGVIAGPHHNGNGTDDQVKQEMFFHLIRIDKQMNTGYFGQVALTGFMQHTAVRQYVY
jgi:hypothetical protein